MEDGTVCAYLDILGFKNYLEEDAHGALDLLENYNRILNNRVIDNEDPDDPWSNLAKGAHEYWPEIGSNSFEYFIPFSDAIFIQSSSPTLFLYQLSHFLLECYLDSWEYIEGNLDEENIFDAKVIKINEEREINIEKAYCYPILFRGGVAFGESAAVKLRSINKGKLENRNVLFGKQVVEAVQLEAKVEGPRIICNKKFCDLVHPEEKRLIIKSFYPDKPCEILWPAVGYIRSNNAENGLEEHFNKLFKSALVLWKYFEHKEYGIKYYNFLKLIVISTLHYWSDTEADLKFVKRYIDCMLERENLINNREDLFGVYN